MTLVLDAGALVALERRDRDLLALLKREARHGRVPRTHAGVLGQVWRGGGGRQSTLAAALRAMDVRPLDESLARRAGVLLGSSGTADVIDAAVVLLAEPDDDVLTSDPEDIAALAASAGRRVEVVPV